MTGRFVPAAGGYRNFNCDLGFVISNDGLHWREPVWKSIADEATWRELIDNILSDAPRPGRPGT